MLFLLQAAVTQVHVVVDKLPSAQGMSDFQKTLLSASVGAVFGVGGSIVSSWFIRRSEKRQKMATVKSQLTDEVAIALTGMESCIRVFNAAEAAKDHKDAQGRDSFGAARGYMHIVMVRPFNDRYAFYFSTEKAIVYDLDPKQKLETLHRKLGRLREQVVNAGVPLSIHSAIIETKHLVQMARSFLDDLAVPFQPGSSPFEETYINGITNPYPDA